MELTISIRKLLPYVYPSRESTKLVFLKADRCQVPWGAGGSHGSPMYSSTACRGYPACSPGPGSCFGHSQAILKGTTYTKWTVSFSNYLTTYSCLNKFLILRSSDCSPGDEDEGCRALCLGRGSSQYVIPLLGVGAESG